MHGSTFGLNGAETASEINGREPLLAMVAEVRAKAAVLFGFVEQWQSADTQSPGLPMLGLVSAPVDYRSINGLQIHAEELDVRVHLIFLGSLHESIAGTGSVCLAAASRIPGSVVHDRTMRHDDDVLLIGHPSGGRVRLPSVHGARHRRRQPTRQFRPHRRTRRDAPTAMLPHPHRSYSGAVDGPDAGHAGSDRYRFRQFRRDLGRRSRGIRLQPPAAGSGVHPLQFRL